MRNMLTLFTLCFSISLLAQNRFDNVTIEVIPLTDHIYMLKGAGGNIGISTGDDGVFMIDDQFAPLSIKITKAISTISDQSVTFLVNTHFHGDHTGGNANFKAQGAYIVAHDNVRKRLQNDNDRGSEALPVITFSDDTTFYLNGDTIYVTHVHNAHTDGDALVYFMESNVLHAGDTFFNGRFPYIDIARGGGIQGDIEAAKKGLMLVNDDTIIIPGHGSKATKADYQNYLAMLEGVYANIQVAIAEGKTEDDIAMMESLTSAFYTDEATKDDFITGEKFRRTVYKSIQNAK